MMTLDISFKNKTDELNLSVAAATAATAAFT